MSRLRSPQQIKMPKEQETFLIQSLSSRHSKITQSINQSKVQDSVRKIIELKRANNRKNQQSSKIKKQQQSEIIKSTQKIKDSEYFPQKKTLLYQYKMLKKVPTEISVQYKTAPQKIRLKLQSIEYINLFTNYLIQFEDLAFQKLTYLRELDLSENLISQIPAKSINENLVNLETLKLNSNHIENLPYLKHVRNLEMLQNPLKKLTRKLISMNVKVLKIDWLQYLHTNRSSNSLSSSSMSDSGLYENKSHKKSSFKSIDNNHPKIASVQILKYQYLKKLNEKFDKSHKYYDFKTLFKLKAQIMHPLCFEEIIAELLSNAIQKQHVFFIQYLQKQFPELYYNRMTVCDKFLLEEALRLKGSNFFRLVLGLFMPKKWPYESSSVFIDNLFLSIKYQSVSFFTYLVELPIALDILFKNRKKIIDFLLVQYKETAESSFIATILCQKMFKKGSEKQQNQIIQLNLSKYPLSKSRSIVSFWNFIIRNQKLNKIITLAPRSSFYENSILHFAIKSPYYEETLDLMINAQNRYQIFQKNALGQSPRSQFSGNRFFKKVLWKLQKQFFQQYQSENKKNHPKINAIKSQNEIKNIFNTPFIKLSQFRNKGLKQIIRLLGIQCPQIKVILQNCKNNEFTQKQQQTGFILHQIIQRLPHIQPQLNLLGKKLSNCEFQMIIFKLLQTQIFDKRSYLAGQVGKILLHKNQQTNNLKVDKNKTKESQQKNNQYQINYSDDQLLAQYQLFHSIQFLKTQNFMVSSSLLQNQQQKVNQQIGMFDISRFGCRKCQ